VPIEIKLKVKSQGGSVQLLKGHTGGSYRLIPVEMVLSLIAWLIAQLASFVNSGKCDFDNHI
jgi:hypothetical protein